MAAEARELLPKSGTTTGASAGLPDDLKEHALRRIATFAWIVLGLDLVGMGIDHAVAANVEPAWPDRHHVVDLIGSGAIALLCLVMIAVARSKLSIDARLRGGVAFFVVLAGAVSITDHGDAFWTHDGGAGHMLHGVPSLVVVMLVTPVLLPLDAVRTFAVTLAMAATGPLSIVVDAAILGVPVADTQPLLQSFPFLMVPVSAALGHVVHRLGLDVRRARALGSYTLEDKLGEGGMGEVWRARHRFLARPAAVKLIRPGAGAGDATRRERFEREAQATAALRSPHTVEVYDFGVSREGEIYYVMELLDGVDLDRLIDTCGPQPAARVVGWLRQACHSLREAHAAGIVHRDIKPANLFACRYGLDHDFVKVLDFGLATLGPSVETDDPRLTAEGKIVGTPAYMAPEQATGTSPSDARSDLYALGCVAYFALSGRQVFEGKSPIEVILGHVDRAPVPPSQVTRSAVPEALERLILDCLAKAPADRPASAQAVLDRLEGLPAWSDAESAAWWAQNRPRLAEQSPPGAASAGRPLRTTVPGRHPS